MSYENPSSVIPSDLAGKALHNSRYVIIISMTNHAKVATQAHAIACAKIQRSLTSLDTLRKAVRNRLCKSGLPIGFTVVTMIMGFLIFPAYAACLPTGERYCNPPGSVTDIVVIIKSVLKYLFLVTIPLAGLGIILSGLFYVYAAASGDTSKTTTAKKTFTYILIGAVFVIGALALAAAIINFLEPVKPATI